jgi:hypothetical protein
MYKYNMNSWIKHVKAYQAKHGCSYKEALQGARTSYKKGGGIMSQEPVMRTWGDHLKLRNERMGGY